MPKSKRNQRIKTKRQGQLKNSDRAKKPHEATCPLCGSEIYGSLEELNLHVHECLKKDGSGVDEEEYIDVEGDSEGDGFNKLIEYECAGQRRIRASSLLVGGYAGLGMASTSSAHCQGEEEEDVVVDGDVFGAVQFSEADLVTPCVDGGPREEKESHGGISESGAGRKSEKTLGAQYASEESPAEDDAGMSKNKEPNLKYLGTEEDSGSPLIKSMQKRIKELEGERRSPAFKCRICMKTYKKPVVSICCWHVHCEECWLHTLGAKKLCPQCGTITSPSDLRRIYL